MISKIVRVATSNNFNCTDAEFQQLDTFATIYPEALFFINSNINTKLIHRINEHSYKAVITLNPDINVNTSINKITSIDENLIAFVRIKYIPDSPEILEFINTVQRHYKVVLTIQRFNGKKSIEKYIPDYRKHYVFSHNRFRLSNDSLKSLEKILTKNIYICDQKGYGCGGCGLCSKLTSGKNLPIFSLNLSSSGMCPFNCIDCYAKTMQHFLGKIAKPQIHFDWIHMNAKQSGKTKHIKENLKNKKV